MSTSTGIATPPLTSRALLLGCLVLAALPACATEKDAGLGDVSFSNSGAAAAQAPFLRGVLLLHNFEYEDARGAFREAIEADPDFTLAYWGAAMTHNHPIWQSQELEEARAVLAELAPTREARLAMAPTPRERTYLDAVETLFGEGDKESRDHAYLEAMRRLHEAHPEDHDAAAFHALALLGTAHEGRDFRIYMRAAAIAEEVFAANPRHPGAAHYLIHSYDDPIHAPLGLRPARVYSEVAPDAAHAQHMTSHIFVALGMWEEVVLANQRARDVQDARRGELGRHPNLCGHYSSWLQYGYLQQGRDAEALELLRRCHTLVSGEGPTTNEKWYFARMRARQVLDTESWDGPAIAMDPDLTGTPGGRHTHRFVGAVAALHRGERSLAEEIAAEMEEIRAAEEEPELAIEGKELEALLLFNIGAFDEAVGLLRQAAAAEAALPFDFGPPPIAKPTAELLGEILLQLQRPEEAREALSAALERAPRRTSSLLGLARAAFAAGDEAAAGEAYAELREIRAGADAPMPELDALP